MKVIRCHDQTALARYLLAAINVKRLERHMHEAHLSRLDFEQEDVETLTMKAFAISRQHRYQEALDELHTAASALRKPLVA
jgi:hypothetical protein